MNLNNVSAGEEQLELEITIHTDRVSIFTTV